MRDDRGPWYLFTGLLLGAALGLIYAWVISPLRYVDTAPWSLREDFRDQYRALIAAAYDSNRDLGRARARLGLLNDPDSYRSLAEQAQRLLAQGGAEGEAKALSALAAALQQPRAVGPGGSGTAGTVTPTSGLGTPVPTSTATSTQVAGIVSSTSFSASPSPTVPAVRTQRPTATNTPTGTLPPTFTSTATQGAPFALQEQTLICDSPIADPLLQVLVSDAADQPVPGVEIRAVCPDGEERFFTGLKPELGLGYADFVMTPGVTYTIELIGGAGPIVGLAAEECGTRAGEPVWGVLLLTFTQP